MTRQETVLQYTKVILLSAILLWVSWATIPITHAQFAGATYTHITSATNTQVIAISSNLVSLTINGGTGGAVTLYDNAGACSTTVIGVVTAAATPVPTTLEYNLQLKNGLCITTAAATDITVVVR